MGTTKLPKNPKVGQVATIKRKGRTITFKCQKTHGFGMWRITSNKK